MNRYDYEESKVYNDYILNILVWPRPGKPKESKDI